jgi:hypothetical protein
MFPDYHTIKALVDDHQGRLHHQARRRRFLLAGRRSHDDRAIRLDRPSAPVEASPAAARRSTSLGRTPSEVGRAA